MYPDFSIGKPRIYGHSDWISLRTETVQCFSYFAAQFHVEKYLANRKKTARRLPDCNLIRQIVLHLQLFRAITANMITDATMHRISQFGAYLNLQYQLKFKRQWKVLDEIFQIKFENLTSGSPVTSQVRSNTKCLTFPFNAFPPQCRE